MMSILRTTMLSSKGKLCSRKDEVISKLESLKKRLEGMTGTSALRTDARQEAVDAAKQVSPWAIACSSRKFDYKNLFVAKIAPKALLPVSWAGLARRGGAARHPPAHTRPGCPRV
jgi:hypothetical protein